MPCREVPNERVLNILVWSGVPRYWALPDWGHCLSNAGEASKRRFGSFGVGVYVSGRLSLLLPFISAKVLARVPKRRPPLSVWMTVAGLRAHHKWVLMGHHFAAIAGPGPLVGPTLVPRNSLSARHAVVDRAGPSSADACRIS